MFPTSVTFVLFPILLEQTVVQASVPYVSQFRTSFLTVFSEMITVAVYKQKGWSGQLMSISMSI